MEQADLELKRVRADEDEAYRVLASIMDAYAAIARLQGAATTTVSSAA